MKRTAGIVLTTVLEFCFGLFFLMMAAVMLLFMFGESAAKTREAMPPGSVYLMSAIYVAMGAGAIATGIGVWQRRQWARILTLIAGGFITLVGLMTGAIMMMMPEPPGLPSSAAWTGMKIVMAIIFFGLALLGISWIVLFTRPKMREQFALAGEARGEIAAARTCPLSITIIGWFFAVSGGIGGMFQLFAHYPITMFGVVLTGWTAVGIQLAWTIVAIVMGVGLLKLRKWAWNLATGMMAFGGLNGAMFLLLPGHEERVQKLLQLMPHFQQMNDATSQTQWAFSPAFQIPILVVTLGVPLYFLITRKQRYMAVAS